MDLQGSLKKFLNVCSDDFWCKGRILVQVERQTVLIIDGQYYNFVSKSVHLKTKGWTFRHRLSLHGFKTLILDDQGRLDIYEGTYPESVSFNIHNYLGVAICSLCSF